MASSNVDSSCSSSVIDSTIADQFKEIQQCALVYDGTHLPDAVSDSDIHDLLRRAENTVISKPIYVRPPDEPRYAAAAQLTKLLYKYLRMKPSSRLPTR